MREKDTIKEHEYTEKMTASNMNKTILFKVNIILRSFWSKYLVLAVNIERINDDLRLENLTLHYNNENLCSSMKHDSCKQEVLNGVRQINFLTSQFGLGL